MAYTNVMDQKVKQDLDLDTALKGVDIQSMAGMTTVPLCMVDSISQDGNTYKMTYNSDVFNGMFAEIFNQMALQVNVTDEMKAQGITEDMFKVSMDLSKADIEITFKDGGLYDEKADMAMTMEMMGQKIEATINMNMSATKVGDAVTVTYPSDLDTYKTLEEVTTESATATEVTTENKAAEEETATDTAETTPAAE